MSQYHSSRHTHILQSSIHPFHTLSTHLMNIPSNPLSTHPLDTPSQHTLQPPFLHHIIQIFPILNSSFHTIVIDGINNRAIWDEYISTGDRYSPDNSDSVVFHPINIVSSRKFHCLTWESDGTLGNNTCTIKLMLM